MALQDVDARVLPVKKLEKILGEAGLTRENEIIVYGTKGDTGPTVVFWILEYLGAKKAKVYHGGIDDWMTARQAPLTNEPRKLPAAKFTAKVRRPDVIATTDYVKKNLQNKETQFIDTRTVKEYRETISGRCAADISRPPVMSTSRIEYAWKDPEAAKKLAEKVQDREGMALKDAAGIKELYKGVDPKKEVVAYCQTGTRSTQTYAVLREMGYQKVRNYDDSWIVWGSDRDLPAKNVSYFDFVKVNAAMKKLEELEKRLAALEPKK